MTESTYPFQQKRWSLADLFPAPNSPELEAAFVQVKQMASDFTQVREQLTPDIPSADFLALARRYEELSDLLYRMNSYAGLAFAEDTQNQATLALMARIEQFTADITNETLFFSLWWKMLDDANAERLMAVSGDYRYWLEEMRHFKPHTLSEAEEKIINIKDVTGANALRTLYDAITNRYVFELEVNGDRKSVV